MSKLPLLVLPKAIPALREKGSQKFFSIAVPTPHRQKQRLGDKFSRLEQAVLNRADEKTISADMHGLYPDRTIVFELARSRPGFKKAVEKLGLSWIGEDDFELPADQDFHSRNKPDEALEGRLYLTSPDERSLAALISMWKSYLKGDLEGNKEWNDLFSHLKDIRRWGPRDRLPSDTLAYLDESELDDDTTVHLEVEAVFFGASGKDAKVKSNLAVALGEANATILDAVTIEEIRYQAFLIEISKSEIPKLRSFESALLAIDEIGYIRPQSMSKVLLGGDDFSEEPSGTKKEAGLLGKPVAALFDGVPVQNHQLLDGRVVVHDPDGLQSISPVNTRHHSTAMASLILHGDLPLKEAPLSRQLYIHCLLCATDTSAVETTPRGRLIIGLVHNAVKSLRHPSSVNTEDICIINLSLGDCNRPFTGQMSAWARLIDYLSWKYNLLFIVSAGNIKDPLSVQSGTSPGALNTLTVAKRRASFVSAWEAHLSKRTLFSPAESLNAITVGALHSDGSTKVSHPILVDPFESDKFPSLINGLGLGYRRAIKPDLLHSGGRALYSIHNAGANEFGPSAAVKYFGQEVAGVKSLSSTTRMIGTSNAAALVTRTAVQLYDVIQDMKVLTPGFAADRRHVPCLLKALLVHSATWGEAGIFLDGIIKPQSGRQWQSRRTNITRFLGYGAIEVDRVLACTEHRVTLIGTGAIAPEKAEIFEFPLPPAISGTTHVRRLTVTLAWISPIRPGEHVYRAAALEFKPADKNGFPIGTQRVPAKQPPIDAAKRGTVVHEIFEGKDAVPIVDGDKLRLRVESKAQGSGNEKIPYAIGVTFEVATEIKANIYQQIASRIAIKPSTRVRA